ncbi:MULTISPECIES: glycosyltransferase family 9 protein [unclassified Bordetella]|uniref:glycosyltransferase family 9 protein n=1 Tax=unclassified Bordetella TaxID=2630031 RepID=UPI001323013D|nr:MULTISPECIES: glycosyltransferase family 9 protein [unclassified Bordetella]MVW73190.1 LPS biosynthesis glycosyltransferase [Bordetella sp. 15P40C-2]MVW79892.1 LPS biosynthesis glycosyltransferase [Bordetella sp. 02P26C-1]
MTAVLDPARPPERIAVFRALQLGDMLCSVPAFRALRRAFPQARIALVGLAGAREFVQRFSAYIDELLEFPGISAFPEQAANEAALPEFYRRMRDWRADVAIQLHGSGQQSNPIVEQFGADRWVGFVPRASDEMPGARMLWPDTLPEIERYLALLRYAGLDDANESGLEFPCSEADQAEATRLLDEHSLDPDKIVLIHAGARLASRRWPISRFSAVARGLYQEGWRVALTGTAGERDMVHALRQQAAVPVADLSGRTHLGSMAALVRTSRLLVCNDTGVSHIAAAMKTPSVVVACGSDTRRWAPLDRRRHRVLAAEVPCRPCAYETCPFGHPCALAVSAAEVHAAARAQLQFIERTA